MEMAVPLMHTSKITPASRLQRTLLVPIYAAPQVFKSSVLSIFSSLAAPLFPLGWTFKLYDAYSSGEATQIPVFLEV